MMIWMELNTPEAQVGAYEWAAVLLAHGFIGLALVAALAWATGRMWAAFWAVSVGYLGLWEGAVQDFGAGMADALVDTFAVAAGGLAGISAWARRGAGVVVSLALMAWVLASGVRSRK